VSASDWFTTPENYAYILIGVPMLAASYRVVTSRNVVHAVLYLVAALAASAALFLLLGAEFVAWTVVLVYIGAVVVLFLFGIMITRAPLGVETELSHPRRVRIPAAVVSFVLFLVVGSSMLDAFGDDVIDVSSSQLADGGGVVRTADIGQSIFERFVVPFEVVSMVLLAALIGAIVLARKDPEVGDAAGAEMSEVLR
jgi:NADH-quinone oxidoreductase subunit J